MAANLISQLQNEFSDDVVGRLASYLGEPAAKTQTALGYAIPAIVGGLFQKAQTPQGASDLAGLLQRGGFDGKSFGSIASIARSTTGASDLVKAGGSLLSWLFGPRQSNLTDSIAATSGLGKQASTSLLALAASYVAGLVGREASASGGLNAASLANVLSSQGSYVAAVAPSGLAQVLGISSWERVSDEPARVYERGQPARAYEREERAGGVGWLKWVLPLLLIPVLLWAWRASRPAEPVRSVDRGRIAAPGPSAAAPALVSRTLTCGERIDAASNGVEARMVDFIDDRARPVDETTWFTFDRLEFETGSATLLPGSQPQLRNIATIMNCYPNVNIKVGGYTDNVGDPASNLKLSQARAANTAAAIVAQGILASRVEAEGYGQQHPIASNDTADGRQRNRRIDLRVTRK
jgi:outer membrane protein OmpA-like peptidoglycan-associated protein